MDLFDTTFLESQLFWVTVSFGCLLLLVWKYVTPAVMEILDGRANTIRDDMENASNSKAEAEKVLTEYKKQLQEAKQEAIEIINKARMGAENLATARNTELQADLQRKAEEASQHIEQAKASALDELQSQVAEMAIMAAEKVIGSEIDAKKAKAYTDEVIKTLN